MCLISVIVPIYNAEHTLRLCLDSLLKQTFRDFELILINDGSNDATLDICKEYVSKDDRVKVYSKPNGGLCSARNAGLSHVKGKWVAFCDSDDYVDDNWLSLFFNNINDNQFLVQGLIPHGATYEWHPCIDYEGDVKHGLEAMYDHRIVGYVYIKLFRTDIIKNNNLLFNEKVIFKEDEEFILRYLQHVSKMKAVEEGAYHYIMPDLSKKYLSVDNFICALSSYTSVRKILGKNHKMTNEYLLKLTNSLFDAYSKEHKDCKDKLRSYRKTVKWNFLNVKEVSLTSKIFYCLGNNICHLLFALKARKSFN